MNLEEPATLCDDAREDGGRGDTERSIALPVGAGTTEVEGANKFVADMSHTRVQKGLKEGRVGSRNFPIFFFVSLLLRGSSLRPDQNSVVLGSQPP